MAEGVPADPGTCMDSLRGEKGMAEMVLSLSRFRVVFLMILLVTVGEVAATLLVGFLPPLPRSVPTLINALVHLIVLLPAYFFLFLPLKGEHAERRRAEQEVSFLSRRVLRAVEEEKKRLAHDLHDECGQVLTALQCGIEALKCSLPVEFRAEAQQCDRLASLTAHMGDQVRSLTARLRPAMLESCGLEPTLNWHVEQVRRGWPDLRIDLRTIGCSERFTPEIEITVYRLCQEGLNNIVRHARARHVTINLNCGEWIGLRIEDDGVGFHQKRAQVCLPTPKGFGLLGMRERVADLGGKFTIRTAPGRGTTVGVMLPVKRREDEVDQGCYCG